MYVLDWNFSSQKKSCVQRSKSSSFQKISESKNLGSFHICLDLAERSPFEPFVGIWGLSWIRRQLHDGWCSWKFGLNIIRAWGLLETVALQLDLVKCFGSFAHWKRRQRLLKIVFDLIRPRTRLFLQFLCKSRSKRSILSFIVQGRVAPFLRSVSFILPRPWRFFYDLVKKSLSQRFSKDNLDRVFRRLLRRVLIGRRKVFGIGAGMGGWVGWDRYL